MEEEFFCWLRFGSRCLLRKALCTCVSQGVSKAVVSLSHISCWIYKLVTGGCQRDLFNSGGTEAWDRQVNLLLSGSWRSGIAAGVVLQTQMFCGWQVQGTSGWKEARREHPSLALVTSRSFNHRVITQFFLRLKPLSVGNCTGAPLIQEVEKINVTSYCTPCSA